MVRCLKGRRRTVRDPDLRGVASGIRIAARDLHRDYARHSKEPQWDLVRELVAKPLAQLRETVRAELLRKSADRNAIVPIDRDPVTKSLRGPIETLLRKPGSQKSTAP